MEPLYEILNNHEKKEKSLIPILQDVQNEYDYLPEAVLRRVATEIGMSLSQVYGVATFYSQFHLEPRGDNIIRVCMGTACHVRGGEDILNKIEEELGVDEGETTDDLKFTLESVACIGACGLAPVIMINDDTHGRLTPDKVPEILEQYQ
ncbi:NADH-quinone oxidoreductase subunit NuoE [Sporohalobacter salinus]|uniref:NADH-quinone oxidoreductase subunit NuoE n=1 Tax=Sporohalobacter salinus TaxID=1494606 RepID=UPI0019604B80|nr:NADH-quinone oxidoreductase subunit NuoE [Sporohalobacter salinus]MBM7624146.1 NADH-quinone oxidoreductase subunit E/NADP-reducing hydrogenase subunit HndA [Sporohalobacter salinus]